MTIPRTLLALIAAAPLAVASAQPAVAAESGVKVGVLKCTTGSATGFVVGSTRRMNCTYSPLAGGPPEHYRGRINRWGVDLGYVSGGTMVWAVFAPSSGVPRGALAGGYGGVGGDIAVGPGVGANALIGGFERSVTLQPVNVEGVSGIHIAAGVTSLTLRAVPRDRSLGGLPSEPRDDAYPHPR